MMMGMSGVRIRQKLESETLHLPQLRPYIGRTVEITVVDDEAVASAPTTPGSGDWDTAARAAEELRRSGYDFDAWRRQRDHDLKHAYDHLP
jgi:hypothetical protein